MTTTPPLPLPKDWGRVSYYTPTHEVGRGQGWGVSVSSAASSSASAPDTASPIASVAVAAVRVPPQATREEECFELQLHGSCRYVELSKNVPILAHQMPQASSVHYFTNIPFCFPNKKLLLEDACELTLQIVLQVRFGDWRQAMSSSTESALTKVYDAGGDTGVAIIFVHGLGGNWLSTWRSGSDISAFWPTWLANDIGGLSVYSVRYDASPSKWQGAALPLVDRATNLFEVLAVEEALRDRSIVFVCHSLGGLVVKTILRIAADREDVRQDAKRLLQKTRGVVFLGTPHLGSRHANLADFFRVLFRPTASTLDLRKDNAELRDLNNWYRNWATNRQIKHLVFAETRATLIGALVDQSSADPGIYKTDSIPIDADHNSLVKPATKQALVYKLVCYFLLSLFPQKLKAAFAERVDTAQFQEDMNLGASAKPLLLDRLANYFLGKPLKALFALSTATLAIAASVLAIWTTLLPCTEKWLSSADYQACFEETVQNRDVYPVMVRGKQNFLGNELIRSEWRTYPVDASSFCWYSCSRLNSRTLNRVNIQMSSEGYNPISITSFRGANEREIYMVTWQKFVAADGQCGKQLNCRGEEQ